MNLKDYFQQKMEEENRLSQNAHIRYREPKTPGEIVDLYRKYDGLQRQMRALNSDQVEEYMAKGYAFAGAYDDRELVGIVASKEFPENYPYFHLPKNEVQGKVSTLGGLYVDKNHTGLGIASHLSYIASQATRDYGVNEENAPVGMAYEVSYDNTGSLRVLGKQGHFVGYYSDTAFKEGLSLLLYKPFMQTPVEIVKPNILLTDNEQESQINLAQGFEEIAAQPQIGGFEVYTHEIGEGNIVTTNVLNTTPRTVPEQTFEVEQ